MTTFRSRDGSLPGGAPAALLFLALTVLLFYGDVLFGGDALITANMSRWLPWRTAARPFDLERPTFRDDSAITYYPRRVLTDREWSSGRVPLWNRYILCGTPHMADFQSAVFHPLNLLLHFVDAKRATALFLVAHLLLGAVFLYLFLRRLRVGPAGALIGAVSFLFNAYFATYIGHPVHISTGCWLPMILLLVSRGVEGKGALWLPLAAAVMILGGFPQTILYTLMIAAAWALFLWWGRPPGGRAAGARRLAVLGALMAVAFGLVLFQLLPTAEFGSLTSRKAIDLGTILELHQPSPYSAIRMVLPDFYGNPVSENFWLRAVEGPLPHPNDLGFIGYGGIIPLILAAAALLFCRRREVRFFAGLSAVALLLAFSPQAYALYYKALPFARFSSELHRLQFPFLFGVAVLAGFGFQEIVRRRGVPGASRGPVVFFAVVLAALPILAALLQWAGPSFLDFAADKMMKTEGDVGRNAMLVPPLAARFLEGDHAAWLRHEWAGMGRLLLFAGAGVLLMIVLARRGGRTAAAAATALALLATADGWTFAHLYHTPQRAEAVFAPHPLLDRLRSVEEPFRIARLTVQYYLPSNTALPYGIEDVAGVNALMPARYGAIFEAIDPSLYPDGRRITPFHDPAVLSLPLWDMLGVRYLLAGPVFDPGPPAEGDADDERPRWKTVWRDPTPSVHGSASLLENRDALPRAYISHTYEIIASGDEIVRRLVSPRFAPKGPILLEEAPGVPSGAEAALPRDECRIVSHESSTVRVRTRSDEPGLLFLSETDYPGWVAEVDGEEAPILRANYAFRAVPLAAGGHDVVFRYEAPAFRRGLCGSAAALAIYAVWVLLAAVRSRRGKPSGPA